MVANTHPRAPVRARDDCDARPQMPPKAEASPCPHKDARRAGAARRRLERGAPDLERSRRPHAREEQGCGGFRRLQDRAGRSSSSRPRQTLCCKRTATAVRLRCQPPIDRQYRLRENAKSRAWTTERSMAKEAHRESLPLFAVRRLDTAECRSAQQRGYEIIGQSRGAAQTLSLDDCCARASAPA